VLAPNAIEKLRDLVTGSTNDVHVTPGRHDGYEVHFGCKAHYWGFSVVSVQGVGTQGFPLSVGDYSRELEAQFWDLAEEVRRVAGVASIHEVEEAPLCRSAAGWAIGLELSDYRDIDQAVLRVGPWLAHRDLAGEIVLWILPRRGPPVLGQGP
jgi:hypothetical protein